MAQKVKKPTPKAVRQRPDQAGNRLQPWFQTLQAMRVPQMIGHPCKKCGAYAVLGEEHEATEV